MNSADEKVFEEALSGALADIQSDWENPDALLLACKDALPPDYVPSRRFSRKMQRLLRRSKKRRFGFSGAGKRWIPRLAVVLSMVLLSFAAVDAGIGLKRRIHIDQFPTHTSFLLEAAGQNSLREGDFSWVHLPSYVPQGFEVQEVKSSPRSILIDYRDGEKVLYISQRYMEIDGNASIQIDTEDAKTEYLDVNGNRALYVEKEGWRKIYIFENDCFTKIRSNGLSKRKLLKVAKSLTDLE